MMTRKDPRTRILMSGTLIAAVAVAGLAAADGESATTKKSAQPRLQAQVTVGSDVSFSGASAEQIKQLQRELASRGLYQGQIDGVAGSKTQAALRNFQVQQGIATNGLNRETANALGLSWERQPVSGTRAQKDTEIQRTEGRSDTMRVERQPAPVVTAPPAVELSSLTSEQTTQLQQRLQQLGYYRGELDGVMGARTRGALQRYFQSQAQLAAQGKMSDPEVASFGITTVRGD